MKQKIEKKNKILCGKDYDFFYDYTQNKIFFMKDGNITFIETLKSYTNYSKIKKIKNGNKHILILYENGILLYFNFDEHIGTNLFLKNLGEINKINKFKVCPIRKIYCGENFSLILFENEMLYYLEHNTQNTLKKFNTNLQKNEKICKIYTSSISSNIFIKTKINENYKYYGMGYNNFNQLGIYNYIDYYYCLTHIPSFDKFDIKHIYTINNRTIILLNNNDILGLGLADEFILSLYSNDEDTRHIKKIPISSYIKDGSYVIDITHSLGTIYFLMSNNKIYVVGKGMFGEHGDGYNSELNLEIKEINFFSNNLKNNNENKIIKIKSNYLYTFVMLENKNVYKIGGNKEMMILKGNEYNKNLLPKKIEFL